MIEALPSGIVLGLIPITLAGLFVTAYSQYRRGDQLDIWSGNSHFIYLASYFSWEVRFHCSFQLERTLDNLEGWIR